MFFTTARQQQAQTGAAQQQIIEVQHHFRLTGEGQLCPQGVGVADRFVTQLGDQLRQSRQVATVASGQTSPLLRAESGDRQWRYGGKNGGAIIFERATEHVGTGLEHFDGLRAKRRQFAAGQGDATRLLPQHMFTGFIRRLALLLTRRAAHHRTHADQVDSTSLAVTSAPGNCCVQAASR